MLKGAVEEAPVARPEDVVPVGGPADEVPVGGPGGAVPGTVPGEVRVLQRPGDDDDSVQTVGTLAVAEQRS